MSILFGVFVLNLSEWNAQSFFTQRNHAELLRRISGREVSGTNKAWAVSRCETVQLCCELHALRALHLCTELSLAGNEQMGTPDLGVLLRRISGREVCGTNRA